ncbi:hypothetical protein [Sphingobium aromaticiconvertens]|uniref:hypothetical protein n=1 Tax=Sphingobium aromaticiconvertens TaxID=365341 RepID=UPI0030188D32
MLNEWSDRDPDPPRRRSRFLTLDFWLIVLFVPMTVLGLVELGGFMLSLANRLIALMG